MSQTLFPQQNHQKKQILPPWLKNTLLIGFISGFTLGLLTPLLLHLSATLLSEFISLIQQPQMANAMQSIGGIIEVLGVLFAVYKLCQRRIKKKNFTTNQDEKEGSEPTKQSGNDDP
jgi:cbb3-type cytochrome oxidase subunit 1